MVTSNAVVGSLAISRRGSQDKAIAIIMLLLPARELMRIRRQHAFDIGQTDRVQHLRGAFVGGFALHAFMLAAHQPVPSVSRW